MDPEEEGKAVLRPRRPGESLKVAETVLRRRDRNLKAQAERAAAIAKVRKSHRDYKKGKLKIIRAEKLVKNARIRQADRRRLKNKDKKPVPKRKKGRVLAVVRNGRLGGDKEVKRTLSALNLARRHTLVFRPNTPEILKQLHTVKPFVFWGPASFKVVFNIVHKKLYFKDPKEPQKGTLLSDNVLIETHLGDLGMLCTEDVAHTLHTCSKHFQKVDERLWPISIGDAKKGESLIREKHFTFGDLGGSVNDKIKGLLGM
eukprot:gnl/TRDRNA2_/TRDRNA2_35279_c0_seq1.p1 gnl/TRDRNA2_/TRDRNA2_35279_c0~~gnl/TRDRNA2_/TRDRNA2_35279_c0_seq1.p1  ORF type:complete len:278 (-),score=57.27 gnl/TRDRNA2_/TRDRNA2_35279_c0_seq1:74-847(-)